MTLKIESTSSSASKDLIRIFLKHQRSGVLATADNAANPHAAVVYYILDDDFTVLFGTKRETQKFKNIEENKQVAMIVYDEATQSTAQIFGHVEVVEDKDTQERVINNFGEASLERSMENVAPLDKIIAGEYVVLRLKPTVIKLAEYGFAKPASDNLFETISFSDN